MKKTANILEQVEEVTNSDTAHSNMAQPLLPLTTPKPEQLSKAVN